MADNQALFPFYTTLSEEFKANDVVVIVEDGSMLPDGPNEICIGAEEPLYITYESIDGNVLSGVTRNLDSFTGDVEIGAHVATYLDMRNDVKSIQTSGLPNEIRLDMISHLLGWNDMMEAWVNSQDEYDDISGEPTGNKIYINQDGSKIVFDADAQVLYTKKKDRYDVSQTNNMKVVW